MPKIAVLLTCFNRRDTTLACLDRLQNQTGLDGTTLEVFLVDDGSTDGTGDSVREAFPDVKVIVGDGNLFWNRGMHRAWSEAIDQGGFDYYLMLNDDTILIPEAISLLLNSAENPELPSDGPSVAVGATVDPDSGELTYGAYYRTSKWNPMKMEHRPLDGTRKLDTMNGNAVLVPQRVVDAVGQFDPKIHHSWGDIDLGYRATKAGFPLSVPRTAVGTCDFNLMGTNAYTDEAKSLRERIKYINSIRGLNKGDWFTLVRKHGGPAWPLVWASPYINLFVVWGRQKLSRS